MVSGMLRKTMILAGVAATVGLSAPIGAVAQSASTTAAPPQQETKKHELECTAATVGGAVIGVAVGSLLGGGLGKTMFEAGGAALGIDRGRHLKCGSEA